MAFKLIGCALLSTLLLAVSFIPQVIYPNYVFAQDEGGTDGGDGGTGDAGDTGTGDTGTGDTTDPGTGDPTDTGTGDQPADTGGATTDPGAIDPGVTDPSAVTDPGLTSGATQDSLTEGITFNEDSTITYSPGSPGHDQMVDFAQSTDQTIDVMDAPPGAQVGDVVVDINNRTVSEVVDSRAGSPADTPTVDTPQEVAPGTPVDTDGDGVIDSIAQDTDGDGESDTFISPFALPTPPPGLRPWIQTFGGDVHSNGTIKTPGGP